MAQMGPAKHLIRFTSSLVLFLMMTMTSFGQSIENNNINRPNMALWTNYLQISKEACKSRAIEALSIAGLELIPNNITDFTAGSQGDLLAYVNCHNYNGVTGAYVIVSSLTGNRHYDIRNCLQDYMNFGYATSNCNGNINGDLTGTWKEIRNNAIIQINTASANVYKWTASNGYSGEISINSQSMKATTSNVINRSGIAQAGSMGQAIVTGGNEISRIVWGNGYEWVRQR